MQAYFCSNCYQYHRTKQPKKPLAQTDKYLKFPEILDHAPSPHEQNFAVNRPLLPKRRKIVNADISVNCQFPQNIAENNNKKSKENTAKFYENQTTPYSIEEKALSTDKNNVKKSSFGQKEENRHLFDELKIPENAPSKPNETKLIYEHAHCLTKESEMVYNGKNKYSMVSQQNEMNNAFNENKNREYSSEAEKNLANFSTNCTQTSSFDSGPKRKEESKVKNENELIRIKNEYIICTINKLNEESEKNKKNLQKKKSQGEAPLSLGNDQEKRVLKHYCNKEIKENANQKKNVCLFYDNRCFGLSLCTKNEIKCVEGSYQLL